MSNLDCKIILRPNRNSVTDKKTSSHQIGPLQSCCNHMLWQCCIKSTKTYKKHKYLQAWDRDLCNHILWLAWVQVLDLFTSHRVRAQVQERDFTQNTSWPHPEHFMTSPRTLHITVVIIISLAPRQSFQRLQFSNSLYRIVSSVQWISPNLWVTHWTNNGGKLGRPNHISWLPELFWVIFKWFFISY